MAGANKQLDIGEVVYRRMPISSVFVGDPPRPPWQAFRPRDPNKKIVGDTGDADGLSVFMATKRTKEDISRPTPESKRYHVAALTVLKIREVKDGSGANGMTVIDDEVDNDGHCLIPELNIHTPKPRKEEWALGLSMQCEVVLKVPQ